MNPRGSPSPGAGLAVLIVDDQEPHRYIAKRLLLELGCNDVGMAGDGFDALQTLSGKQYDLVLMDIEMAGLDGLETTRRIRAGEAGPRAAAVPIVALTGIRLTDARQLCLDAGMDGFLAKPCNINELATILLLFQPEAHAPGKPLSVVDPASKTAQNAAPPPRMQRQQALERMGGDETIYTEIWTMTLMECPEKLQAINDCLAIERQGNDCQDKACLHQVGRYAHQLKSLFRTIGAMRAAAYALELETAAKEGRVEQAVNAFAAMEKEILAVLRA